MMIQQEGEDIQRYQYAQGQREINIVLWKNTMTIVALVYDCHFVINKKIGEKLRNI